MATRGQQAIAALATVAYGVLMLVLGSIARESTFAMLLFVALLAGVCLTTVMLYISRSGRP